MCRLCDLEQLNHLHPSRSSNNPSVKLVGVIEGANLNFDPLLAPYKQISKHLEKTAEGDEVLLTCQAEGYPESSVEWQDGRSQRHSPSTTATTTPDDRFKITSQIKVSRSEKNNYTCSFANDATSATFHIPGIFLCLLY